MILTNREGEAANCRVEVYAEGERERENFDAFKLQSMLQEERKVFDVESDSFSTFTLMWDREFVSCC